MISFAVFFLHPGLLQGLFQRAFLTTIMMHSPHPTGMPHVQPISPSLF